MPVNLQEREKFITFAIALKSANIKQRIFVNK